MPNPSTEYATEVAGWLRGDGPVTHLPQQPSPFPVPIYLTALTCRMSGWPVRCRRSNAGVVAG
jgi:hypothetical protein